MLICAQGYKLVALALGEAEHVDEQGQQSADLSLRNTTLWFPTIPDQKLYLNKASFIGEPPSTSDYRPLAWILFGGCDGNELSTITDVTVLCGGSRSSAAVGLLIQQNFIILRLMGLAARSLQNLQLALSMSRQRASGASSGTDH